MPTQKCQTMALPSKRRKLQSRLMLDTVIGTQPELGPAPPDGGYGWIILFGVTMVQITIPSILVTSGLLICHILSDNTSMSLKDAHWMWLPTVYCAVWSLTNPWSITLTSVVSGSCMGGTGIILVSSGLIAISLIPRTAEIIYIAVGILAGIGASMATMQSEYLLQKYFSSRLPIVRTLCLVGQAVGEMVMPVLIGSLLTKFGLTSTLLLQAGITLQALIGAVLFRKPQYTQTTQKSIAYTLLQNEDMEESGNTEDTDLEENLHVSNGIVPHKSPAEKSDEMLSDITSPDTSQNFNFHSSPTADSLPQPLFTDVELGGKCQNTTFFIEDSDNDIDLYVRRGGFTQRNLPCSQELKVLCYPVFYCALILTAITKMSIMSFWILIPLVLKSRLPDFQFNQAAIVLSVGGIANLCSAVGSHWLPAVSARQRKFIFILLSFIAAGGLYMLNYSFSWAELLCAAVLVRLGTGGVTTLLQQVLEDTMGASQVIKTHTLLHTFTGLLIGLGMVMMMSLNFTSPFNILAGIQLGAGSLWCIQAIFNRLCNE